MRLPEQEGTDAPSRTLCQAQGIGIGRYAGRRRRTEHEVRAKLAALDFPPAVIETVVVSLRDSGVLDDRAYVRAYIHDVQLRRPAGARMIAFRLRGKGLEPDLLREEIESALGPAEETRLARHLARRYDIRLHSRRGPGASFLPGEPDS